MTHLPKNRFPMSLEKAETVRASRFFRNDVFFCLYKVQFRAFSADAYSSHHQKRKTVFLHIHKKSICSERIEIPVISHLFQDAERCFCRCVFEDRRGLFQFVVEVEESAVFFTGYGKGQIRESGIE